MDPRQEIDELVEELNKASEAYYNDRDEIMSNFEWDSLFDRLSFLEQLTGYIRDDSPTVNTGAQESAGSGNREAHEYPALSLAKSKDVTILQKWAGDRPIWLSWKLDGITLVATYDNGRLTRLMTRGNGQIGTNITILAPYIGGLPKKIKETGHFVVRGEATIAYPDFERLNELVENDEEKYANPRNLVAGTLALDETRASEVKERRVCFNAFTLVHCEERIVSWGERMGYLRELGFTTVDYEPTTGPELPAAIARWTEIVRAGKMQIPVDGLVIAYDDTDYAATGSVTGHHATNAGMAFKWQDSEAETMLDHIEWSCAVGSITPVAVFDPVQLEGTEVKRASLCNISELRRLGIGADRKTNLTVIKANMIIPKVVKANAHRTKFKIPKKCPVCGAPTELRLSEKTGTETLHCTNPDCTAKQVQKYSRFVSKPGMDIDGISVETLVKFINKGWLSDAADIYSISSHETEITAMEGFGKRSFAKLAAAVEKSRKVHPVNFIYALCIPMIGRDAAKKFIAAYGTKGFFDKLAEGEDFSLIDGIGPEKAGSLQRWYAEAKNRALLDKLLKVVTIEPVEPEEEKNGKCSGLTFVITGDVHTFRNRDEFKAYVESEGGKVSGAVSKKTDYLVNNDMESLSLKNQKAKELGTEIISEDRFRQLFG